MAPNKTPRNRAGYAEAGRSTGRTNRSTPMGQLSNENGNDSIEDAKNAGGSSDAEESFKPITSQDEFNRIISGRLDQQKRQYADYDDLKAKAARLDEIEQANKSDLEKVTEERDRFKSDASSAAIELARLQVALDKGLSPSQAKRLVGATREELEKDADELLADLGVARGAPKPNPAQGRDGAVSGTGDWLRDQLARN